MKLEVFIIFFLASNFIYGVYSTVLTIKNNCPYGIAPAALTGSGVSISTTGFQLAPHGSNTINIPGHWSGRVWARYQCSNNGGKFHCNSGDCGSGQVACNGHGDTPPATLIEFTIDGSNSKDTYDISLVDGFNLPVSVAPSVKPQGRCQTISCPVDINTKCPSQLAMKDQAGETIGCKSACVAFNKPQYCCTGAYHPRAKCKPTTYSMFFKKSCPSAYSYADDDPSSTFTCNTGTNYLITFCP